MGNSNKVERGLWGIMRGAILIAFFLGVASCGEIGGSGQCGGSEFTGSCLRIDRIEPLGAEDKETSNVDVALHLCPDGKPEKGLFDHNARVTFSNHPLPGVDKEDTSDIELKDFSIVYTVNYCPAGATCPPLKTLKIKGDSLSVPRDSAKDIILPFVPLAVKDEYVNGGGSLSHVPSYSATYTVIGTDSFQNGVSVKGSAEFSVADFNLCTATGS